MALNAAIRFLTAGETRWFILATVLYVAPLMLSALAGR
jgi:hypothetical protein